MDLKHDAPPEYESDCEEENNQDNQNETHDIKEYIRDGTVVKYGKKMFTCRLSTSVTEIIKFWELQRNINEEKVENIYKSMLEYYSEHGEYEFLDPIHIVQKNYDDKNYYVVDGQHRLEAYKKVIEVLRQPIPFFPAMIRIVDNEDEFIKLFEKINNRLIVDINSLMQLKLQDLMKRMEAEWPCSKKSCWGYNRPFLNKEKFCKMARENAFCIESTSAEIFLKLLDVNHHIKQQSSRSRTKDYEKKYNQKAESWTFFLGLDKTMSWFDMLE
jgi:hypothetical protein